MTRRRLILVLVILGVLAAGSIAAKYVWRAASLRWAKNIAIEGFTPDDSRGGFDMVPVSLRIAPSPVAATELIDLRGHKMWVLQPQTREDNEQWVDLRYERYRVRILTPMILEALGEIVRQWGMKDHFAVLSAAHHATRKGLETQPDIESVKRNVLLLGLKSTVLVEGSSYYYAEFEAGDVRGFISGDIGQGKRRVLAEVFPSGKNVQWGLVIVNSDGASMDDIKGFIAAMREGEIEVNATVPAGEK